MSRGSALALLMAGSLACGDDGMPVHQPPAGFSFAYATPSCAPWDGPAVTLYLTPQAVDSGSPLPPPGASLGVSIWKSRAELPGARFSWPSSGQVGAAQVCTREAECEAASGATVAFGQDGSQDTLQGMMDLAFPQRGRITGDFRARWIQRSMFCG